jgi:hypothetical protein
MTETIDYAIYRTLEAAERSLEDSYATGDILPGEHPQIVKRSRKTASWSTARPVYAITLTYSY